MTSVLNLLRQICGLAMANCDKYFILLKKNCIFSTYWVQYFLSLLDQVCQCDFQVVCDLTIFVWLASNECNCFVNISLYDVNMSMSPDLSVLVSV